MRQMRNRVRKMGCCRRGICQRFTKEFCLPLADLGRGTARGQFHESACRASELFKRHYPQLLIHGDHPCANCQRGFGSGRDFLLPHQGKFSPVAGARICAGQRDAAGSVTDYLCGGHHHFAGLYCESAPQEEGIGGWISGSTSGHGCFLVLLHIRACWSTRGLLSSVKNLQVAVVARAVIKLT
jgi:hypothetical protein